MNSTEKAITSFFDFLNEHIRIEFKNTKNEYLLESYSFDEFGRKELPLDEDGYYLIFPKDSRDYEIFARLELEGNAYNEYLNPFEQKKYRKWIDNDTIERYSLYNTLKLLYSKKRIEFYSNIIKRASEGFQSNELRQRYINDLIIGLEFNSKRVNNPVFSIKDGQGTDCLLLYVTLKELMQKIQNDYLKNEISNLEENEIPLNIKNKTLGEIATTSIYKIEFNEIKEERLHGNTQRKNIRDIDLTNFYIQKRECNSIKDSMNLAIRNFKNYNGKCISPKTFQRAIENCIELLFKAGYIDDFIWTRKHKTDLNPNN